MDTGTETRIVDLPAELVLRTVGESHQLLAQALEGVGDVEVTCEAVERVDTAGVQLLYAFDRAAQSRGLAVRWGAPSDALAEAVGVAGWDPFGG